MGTTVVDIQQQHRKFLGQPYSICVETVSQLQSGLLIIFCRTFTNSLSNEIIIKTTIWHLIILGTSVDN